MKNRNLLGTIELLIATFIWGSTFVAQSAGMDYVGPFTFLFVRFIIGAIVLLPLIAVRNVSAKKSAAYRPFTTADKKKLVSGGVVCGCFLFVAAALQQIGIIYTTVGKAGFITTLYVIFVPLFGLFLGKRPSANVWISVVLAVVGLYLLCMTEGLTLSLGDTLVLLCALCFTGHIMAVDKVVAYADPIKLSCVQFLTVGILSFVPAVVFENPSIDNILAAWLPILYAGLLSSGVAYTLQVVAQRHAEPTVASITMSFESVFAVVSGFVILEETISPREGFGCFVMLAAIILAQLPPFGKLKKQV